MTKSTITKKRTRRLWTKDEDDLLRRRYPHESTDSIAADMGRSKSSIYARVASLWLHKSDSFMAQKRTESVQKLNEMGAKHRFQAGLVPWNAGRRFVPGGRSIETRFKPGQKPHTWRPIGTERLTKEGYLERKVMDTCVTKNDYKPVHHIVWEEAGRGEIPPGHVLAFKDGNKRNFALENLELLTRKQLMARNTIHNYGPEVAQLAQLRGAIKRQINRLEGKDNEQR